MTFFSQDIVTCIEKKQKKVMPLCYNEHIFLSFDTLLHQDSTACSLFFVYQFFYVMPWVPEVLAQYTFTRGGAIQGTAMKTYM